MTDTSTLAPCSDCGMPCAPNEYHPYAACLMFKACHNSDVVRANLDAVHRAPAPVAEPETLQPGDVRPIVIGGTLCEDGRWYCEALECYVDPEDCDVLPMTPAA